MRIQYASPDHRPKEGFPGSLRVPEDLRAAAVVVYPFSDGGRYLFFFEMGMETQGWDSAKKRNNPSEVSGAPH